MSVGLICEFNPFHYGHRYLLNKIKELKNEPIVCIMSGPFVQRAEPACADKFSRTRAALTYGADAVIELPVKFSTAAAKTFARGGVEVLKNIKGVSALAFGVETDDPEILYKIVEIKKLSQTDELIRTKLSDGVSYPSALAKSVTEISGDRSMSEVLKHPNNILAVEYIDALYGTGISALPIKRMGNSYNDSALGEIYSSATAIRENLQNENVKNYLPPEMYEDCIKCPPDKNLYGSLILYSLRKLSLEQLSKLPDVENGLEYNIKKASALPNTESALGYLKSKRYTYARLKRIFLYAMLGIDKQVMSDINSVKTRVLGIKKEFKPLLTNLSHNIITRNSDADTEFRNDRSVAIDAFADDIYSILTGTNGNAYYSSPMIVL